MAGNRLVLVVDDEADTGTSLQAVLEPALHCPVLTFLSAPEALLALDLLGQEQVGLILSDYRMAPMDGLTFLKIAQRSHPAVPRVLATAYPDMDVAIQALNLANISRFLRKPLTPQATVDLVRDLMAQHARHVRASAAFARALRQARSLPEARHTRAPPSHPEGRGGDEPESPKA